MMNQLDQPVAPPESAAGRVRARRPPAAGPARPAGPANRASAASKGNRAKASSPAENKATSGDGGGIYFFGNATAGGTTVRNSTLAGNTAAGRGGAIVLLGSSGTGTLNVQSSTITGNSATTKGGGLYRAANSFVISIDSSIVSGNANAAAPDLFSTGTVNQKSSAIGSGTGFTNTDQGGNLAFGTNLLLGTLGNYGGVTQTIPLLPGSPAINSGSSALTTDQRGKSRVSTADIGAFESQGFNLSINGSGQATIIGTPFPDPLVAMITPLNTGEPVDGGVVNFTPPGAGASANLSGSTVTIASGNALAVATANAMTGTYDVEVTTTNAPLVEIILTNSPPAETPSLTVNIATDVVDNADNKTSLREAIAFANSQAGADTITFDAATFATTQTITLTGGELAITDALTITGTGAKLLTLSGNNASRVLNINIAGAGAAVTVSGVTITGGAASNGAGFLVQDDALTLIDSAIVGNKAAAGDGGGIHVQAGGSLTVRSSTISGNSSNWGGGINFYNGGGSLTFENSTLSGNTANSAGGGVYFNGSSGNGIVVRNSTITANSAGSGGGIYRSNVGTLGITLVSSIVSGNVSSSNPDIFNTATTTVNFSAIGSSDGFTLTGANNLAFGAS